MGENWRDELRAWGDRCAEQFVMREGYLGVMIGGSLARGQEWRHSDLELGVVVEERDQNQPYFNVVARRGVEVIQLVRRDLEEQLGMLDAGDLSPVSTWPIQLWKGKIISDSTGVLARFKAYFDASLFTPEVLSEKIKMQRMKIEKSLEEASSLLEEGRPAAALVKVRGAMNDAILAMHWRFGELPRSQSRTDSRLRLLCKKHECMQFYELYREVFNLEDTQKVIKRSWPLVRDRVLEITRLWGDSAREFFVYSVDSHFNWRQNAGILTVYRLYIPIIGGEQGIFRKLDDSQWSAENVELLRFLGLSYVDTNVVNSFIERIMAYCLVY